MLHTDFPQVPAPGGADCQLSESSSPRQQPKVGPPGPRWRPPATVTLCRLAWCLCARQLGHFRVSFELARYWARSRGSRSMLQPPPSSSSRLQPEQPRHWRCLGAVA